MNEENVTQLVEEAMNPETFDVLEYLEEQPVATETVTIYVDVAGAKKLHQLVTQRQGLLAARKDSARRGESQALAMTDDEEDTEYDEEINSLVSKLEETALVFELKTVAPSLVKAIENHYRSTEPSDGKVEKEQHSQKRTADILSRAIANVTKGDGTQTSNEWTGETLLKLEQKLYPEQTTKLITALYGMVHAGHIFEEALTADFS